VWILRQPFHYKASKSPRGFLDKLVRELDAFVSVDKKLRFVRREDNESVINGVA
jgi:hypothetical protein